MTTDLGFPSIYDSRLNRPHPLQSPLAHLVPEDGETGWHVARNLLKPLNHLDFLQTKEKIATSLNLHSINTPSGIFEQNYRILEQHQARHLTTEQVITHIYEQLRSRSAGLTWMDVRRQLDQYATVRHMEFHPTDVCNLTCQGCTYGHDDVSTKPPPVNFPYAAIHKIAALGPRSAVIIGGGEPTLYRNGDWRFSDVIEEIRRTNPGIALALTTNGTFKPEGDWPDRMKWIRLSLDAASAETYNAFRGRRQFHRVIQNFLLYLKHDVAQVGISFLYSKANIHEYASVAKLIYETVSVHCPQYLDKVNIQYRPLRRDPYQYDRPFTDAIDATDIARAVEDVTSLAESSVQVARFLREQTNVTAVLGGNSHPPHDFQRCHYSQTFKIVRANGDLRPCFIRVSEPDFLLGNLLSDDLSTIALNTLYIGARRKVHCDAHGCRQCHVNYTFEKGLAGELAPSTAPAVAADPMY